MMPERAQRTWLTRALIYLSALIAWPLPELHAQTLPAADVAGSSLEVALITFGPGTEVWERFGHNAILIRDRSSGVENLYNYGIFDFDQKDFFLNFARGRMTYRMAVDAFADELPNYRAEGRWIVEQDLNLSAAQSAKLRDYLDWNAQPENAQYRYEYFTSNCSTRVRDALNMALGGAIKDQLTAPSRGFTFRMDTARLMRPEPDLMLAMDAGLGPFADRRLSYWDESFVPMEFMRHVDEIHVLDAAGNPQPLVAQKKNLADARVPEPPDFPPEWIWQALTCGIGAPLALIGLATLRRRAWARWVFALAAAALALVLGLGGLLLLGLWGLTEHISAWRNENVLLFDPLCLLLLPAWLGAARARWQPSRFARNTAIAVAALAGGAFFVKVFPAFAQDNRFWIALLLPVHLAFALIISRTPFRRHDGGDIVKLLP
jgi:hypothetical protein